MATLITHKVKKSHYTFYDINVLVKDNQLCNFKKEKEVVKDVLTKEKVGMKAETVSGFSCGTFCYTATE